MTTIDAGTLAAADPVVVLPVASVEQHGPHLPLSTDLDIGLGLLASAFDQLPADFPAWVLPPQSIGSSPEHERFHGTLSLDADLLSRVIEQCGMAVARCGVRRVVLSSSHGGNRPALDVAGLRLRQQCGLLVAKASYADFPKPDWLDVPDSEWRHGWHGGAIETAMMLHLKPELVRLSERPVARSLGEELEGRMHRLTPEGIVSFSWLAGDLNRSGVVGNAQLADAETGSRLVRHYGAVLAEVIRDARMFPVERLK
jgi:creatinine amidohydrolase